MNEYLKEIPRAVQNSEATQAPLIEREYMDAPQALCQPQLSRRPSGASAPLSFAQQQVWLHSLLAPGIPLYNEVLILERTGPIDREALARSFCEITRRHEALRATFPVVDGTPIQVIAHQRAVELPLTELAGLPNHQRKDEVLRIVIEEARQSFDLAKGPLMRARLFQFSPESYLLVVAVHTIAADELSLNVLARELCTLYEAYSTGATPPPCDVLIQFAHHAHEQKSASLRGVLDSEIAYWRKRLAGIPPVLELPTDRPRPSQQGFRGARHFLGFSQGLTESLKALSKRERVTLFVTLLAAFQALLSRYTGQDDVVVGSIVPGRDEIGIGTECLIGLFAHTVIVRTDLRGDPTFRELLGRVKDAVREDFEHGKVPFERLISELAVERDPSRNPLFQVLFSLLPSSGALPSGWKRANLEIDTGAAKVDLQLQLYDRPEGLFAHFIYNTDLFDAATVARMAGHWQNLLRGASVDPGQRLSELSLLSDAEEHQLLVEWNDTRAAYPNACVHELIESQVERTPDAVAAIFRDQRLTYQQLNARANQLAHRLRKMGVGPEVLVGVCIERSLDMLVGLLGILKAGGAYVPLDPDYPKERIALMVKDSRLKVLLTEERLRAKLSEFRAQLMCLDSGQDSLRKESSQNCQSGAIPENLAYVIYTSGSTGKPKGVQIYHRAVVNFLTSMRTAPGMNAKDVLVAVTTISFDIAGLELYLPLTVGARVVLESREIAADGEKLREKLASYRATCMQATPATWRLLLESGWEGGKDLKILCGGEALPRDLVKELIARASSVWNLYGPTETTIWSTIHKIDSSEAPVLIGRPIANTEIYILDRFMRPAPIGVPGELYIGGAGLARAYLNRPELTDEKFIPNPFQTASHEARMYRTGDLARYHADGNIECLGRLDHQVKVRGFRIELGEIESVLACHPGIRQSVVVAKEGQPGDKRLVAYFLPAATETALTIDELRNFVKEKLPEYMVPAVFVALKEMPLTPNGKINRRALPAPDQADLAPKVEYATPRNIVESQLVQIWESVLGVRPIGIRHNFFELGGHSLVAVRLMHRVGQRFGKNLPIATLFQAPTVEQLALILQQKGWSPPWSSLVAIQTGGSKPPFFCVHGGAANVLRFRDLAQCIGSDQPFYALQAQGVNAKYPCHTRAEDMAAHYIKEIRTVQSEGPYFLGGYSFGGKIALEMAHQLITQGEKPSLVVLFDTRCDPVQRIPISRVVTSICLKLFRIPPADRATYLSQIIGAPRRAIRLWLRSVRLPRRLKKVRRACEQAEKDYVLRAYPGQIILFQSNRSLMRVGDPYAGWSRYAAHGLKIYKIEGNHDNILLQPQVRFVAEQLKTCLDKHEQRVTRDYEL